MTLREKAETYSPRGWWIGFGGPFRSETEALDYARLTGERSICWCNDRGVVTCAVPLVPWAHGADN